MNTSASTLRSSRAAAGRPAARLLPCAFLVLVAAISSVAAEDTAQVAVLDFDTAALRDGWRYGWQPGELGRLAADDLAGRLVASGRFRVPGRAEVEAVLSRLKLDDPAQADPATLARLGKMLGVRLLVVGSIPEFDVRKEAGKAPRLGRWTSGKPVGEGETEGRSVLSVRVVDTSTSGVVGRWRSEGTCRSGGDGGLPGTDLEDAWDRETASRCLGEALDGLSARLATIAPAPEPALVPAPAGLETGVEGKVAKVDGDKVYLSLGFAAGVKPGDRLQLLRTGEDILDPDTGEVLGSDEITVATVEVRRVIAERLSVAVVVDGGPVRVGDRAVRR